jgi:hypothetical protein
VVPLGLPRSRFETASTPHIGPTNEALKSSEITGKSNGTSEGRRHSEDPERRFRRALTLYPESAGWMWSAPLAQCIPCVLVVEVFGFQ